MEERIIYCLYCPLSKNPVYIGKSKNGINRPWEHIKQKSHNIEVNNWVRFLKEKMENPVIVIIDRADSDNLLTDKESFWINKYISDGYPLLNIAGIKSGYFIVNDFFPEDDYLRFIRKYIITKRKSNNLTQMELSRKAGVGVRFVRELEQGKKNNFNTKSISSIINLFGGILTIN